MPKKRKAKSRQITTPPDANPQRTSPKRDTVQRTVHNGERELDNREYGEGYGEGGKAALCDTQSEEAQGADEGCFDTVEDTLKSLPKEPPPALFEAHRLLDAAETFWGLPEGTLALNEKGSRKAYIHWPRSVVCKLLKDKGMTHESIGKLLGNRDQSTIHNSIKSYNAAVETRPSYQHQSVDFERYCWNLLKGQPQKKYNVVSVNT